MSGIEKNYNNNNIKNNCNNRKCNKNRKDCVRQHLVFLFSSSCRSILRVSSSCRSISLPTPIAETYSLSVVAGGGHCPPATENGHRMVVEK